MQKVKSYRNRAYLDWVKTLPCKICDAPADDPHHVIAEKMGGMGTKASDLAVLPVCRFCHNAIHKMPHQFPQLRYAMETLERAFAEGVFK